MAEYLPSFSPDGKSIIFTGRYNIPGSKNVHVDIFKMDSDGRNLVKLTNDNSVDEFGVWIR